MMIHFWENTFWAKTSLSLEFRGPNSAHPDVFRHANCNCTSFKAVWWSISEKTHWGLKHYFPLYLEGQTQHTLKFSRCSNCNGTSFKAVWWSVSEKIHFGLKRHFPSYLGVQTQHTLNFLACHLQWHKFQSCMMINFWENTFWAKTSLSFEFRGPNAAHPEVLRHGNCNGPHFKSLWWSISQKTHFRLKKYLSFEFRGPNSAHPDVFRCANCNGTSFKALWWSISEKTHFGLKHHFPSYFRGPNSAHPGVSGMPIVTVQVSKLYDDPFMRKHILG